MDYADKEEFLKEFGEDYGYPNGPKSIDQIRATEFKRLENGHLLFLFFSFFFSFLLFGCFSCVVRDSVYGKALGVDYSCECWFVL